jgi:hypothetical protein
VKSDIEIMSSNNHILVEEEKILDLIEPQPKPIINFNVALNYIHEKKHLFLNQGIDSVEIEVVEDICLSQKIKNIKQHWFNIFNLMNNLNNEYKFYYFISIINIFYNNLNFCYNKIRL